MAIIKIIHKTIIYTIIFVLLILSFLCVLINTDHGLALIINTLSKTLRIERTSGNLINGIILNEIIYKNKKNEITINKLCLNINIKKFKSFVLTADINNLCSKKYNGNLNISADVKITNSTLYIYIKKLHGCINGKETNIKIKMLLNKQVLYINDCDAISGQNIFKTKRAFSAIKFINLYVINEYKYLNFYGSINDKYIYILCQNIDYENIKIKNLIIKKIKTKQCELLISYIKLDEFYINHLNIITIGDINIHFAMLNSDFQDLTVKLHGNSEKNTLIYIMKYIKSYDNYNKKNFIMRVKEFYVEMDKIVLLNKDRSKKTYVISRINKNQTKLFMILYVYSINLNILSTDIIIRSHERCNIYVKFKIYGKIGLMSANIKNLMKFE